MINATAKHLPTGLCAGCGMPVHGRERCPQCQCVACPEPAVGQVQLDARLQPMCAAHVDEYQRHLADLVERKCR